MSAVRDVVVAVPGRGGESAEPGEAVMRAVLRLRARRDAEVVRMYGVLPDLLAGAEPTSAHGADPEGGPQAVSGAAGGSPPGPGGGRGGVRPAGVGDDVTGDTPACVRVGAVGAQRPRAGVVARAVARQDGLVAGAARSVAAGLGAGGAAAAPLGKYPDFATTRPTGGSGPLAELQGRARRRDLGVLELRRLHLRAAMREFARREGYVRSRPTTCGWRVLAGVPAVTVWRRPGMDIGRLGGLGVCGQSVCCPWCAPRIAGIRARRVAEAYRRARDRGWGALMLTVTMPHQADLAPGALMRHLDMFRDLWRRWGKHLWRIERGVVEGSHLARELTYGDHGWHYHHHLLVYVAVGREYPVGEAMSSWWSVLDGRSLLTEGAREHSFRVDPVRDETGARYVSKVERAASVGYGPASVAWEVAGGPRKTKGRNLLRLLADYAGGDQVAGRLYMEGFAVVTTTKVASLRWSRGLAAKLGMGGEQPDDRLAADDARPEDVLLGLLSRWQWREVLHQRLELLLVAAAGQGRGAVDALLGRHDLGCLADGGVHFVPEQRRSENPF